jgi:hypothetical protein
MSSRRLMLPSPPLWARWVLGALVAVAVIAGIVVATNRAGPEGIASEGSVEAEINRIADVSITEDEAPHFAGLSVGSAPAPALERAIANDVRQRIAADQLTGPLQGVICTSTGASRAGRRPYRCTVHSAGIAYPFLAVVDASRRRLTWCKVDSAPKAESGPEVPISPSCRG